MQIRRGKLNTSINNPIKFEQYLEDYKNMAKNPI